MRVPIRVIVAVLALHGVACTGHARGPVQTPTLPSPPRIQGAPGTAENPWAQSAREALMQPCGRCHRSDLPTSLPRALAVFDLTHDPWHDKMSAQQLDGLLERVRGNKDVSECGRQVVESFVRCARDKDCTKRAD